MSSSYLLPSAVDAIRLINANAVDNLLAAQPSYAALPSLYQRAYMLVHQTGAVRVDAGFAAPTETGAGASKVAAPITDPRLLRSGR